MRGRLSLAAFLALVVGGGLLIGSVTAPEGWYAALRKPGFTPPGWLFPPVWTVLYILIAVAGWRVWRRDRRSLAMALWIAQLALNFLWSPVFFAAHQVGPALAIIVALLATIAGFIATAARVDRPAAWMFAPYALWMGYAAALNAAIWALN